MKAPAGASNLMAAAAKSGNQKIADYGGEEPAFGRHAGSHRDRHRKRQRHDGDRHPGYRVALRVSESVALPDRREKFWMEEVCGGGSVGHVSG